MKYRKDELEALMEHCLCEIESCSRLLEIDWFYRDKPGVYYDDILDSDGVMEPYVKDNGGDPRCPINGRLKGLFFMANMKKGALCNPRYYSDPQDVLPPVSYFGSTRFAITAERLFNSTTNLYFSDFFCLRGKRHYIQLVITNRNTRADRFCKRNLIKLDKKYNGLLELSDNGTIEVVHGRDLSVEIMFTDCIDIEEEIEYHDAELYPVVNRGRESRADALVKNLGCPMCNPDHLGNTLSMGMHRLSIY